MLKQNSVEIPIFPENHSLRTDFEYSWVESSALPVEETHRIIFLSKNISRADVKMTENCTGSFEIELWATLYQSTVRVSFDIQHILEKCLHYPAKKDLVEYRASADQVHATRIPLNR